MERTLLVIRREQMDALGSVPRRDFEDSLVRHFSRFYPRECARLGGGQLRKLVELSIDRAAEHGFSARRDVGFYCNLMLMLGCDFDHDPQIPWAAEQLDDHGIADPFARIQRLFRTALKYLADAFGENSTYMARALVRIRDYDLDSAPEVASPRFEDDLTAVLELFCPQKFRVQGEEATRALVGQGRHDTGRYGISGGKGLTVYVALMFMVGAGFDRDPVYPWAWPILNRVADEAEKVDSLHRAAIAYVNQVLAE